MDERLNQALAQVCQVILAESREAREIAKGLIEKSNERIAELTSFLLCNLKKLDKSKKPRKPKKAEKK